MFYIEKKNYGTSSTRPIGTLMLSDGQTNSLQASPQAQADDVKPEEGGQVAVLDQDNCRKATTKT